MSAGRLGFFQFERSHPGNPPHVGMCLVAADARAAGWEVDTMLVPPGAVPDLVTHVAHRRYDLIAVDGIFAREAVLAITDAHPRLPILAGGTGALGLLLAAPVHYAIVGAGRVAARAFFERFAQRALPGDVPNLFFRTGAGAIDHTGRSAPWDLTAELEPFHPDLNWGTFGPPRPPGVLESASVVPEWGCAFQEDALASPAYTGRPLPERVGTLAAAETTPRADAALAPYLGNTRGCAFCTFRLQPYGVDAMRATVSRALAQTRWLHETYGITHVSVQSEHPFRFVRALAEALVQENVPVRTLSLRTFPKALVGSAARISEDLDTMLGLGFRVRLQQLGFESFVQHELDLLGKGITVADNVAAARLLFDLDRRHGERVEVFRGHGFILFTPWTRPEDVLENARIVRTEAPFLASAIGLHSRLAFYEPVSPIVRLAASEGLLVPSPRDYGLDHRFADARTDLATRLARAIEDVLASEGTPRAPRLARAALLGSAEAVLAPDAGSTEALFLDARQRATRRLAEDARTWPDLSSADVHRV